MGTLVSHLKHAEWWATTGHSVVECSIPQGSKDSHRQWRTGKMCSEELVYSPPQSNYRCALKSVVSTVSLLSHLSRNGNVRSTRATLISLRLDNQIHDYLSDKWLEENSSKIMWRKDNNDRGQFHPPTGFALAFLAWTMRRTLPASDEGNKVLLRRVLWIRKKDSHSILWGHAQ